MFRTLALPLLALALASIGCASEGPRTGRAEAVADSAADASAVRTASAAWDEAHNDGDLPRLAALYAEDAVSMPYDRPSLEGRAAIEADFAAFFAGHTARHATTIVDLEIDGDRAIEHGRYTLEITPRSGAPGMQEAGKHIVLRRRIGGAWLVTHEIWNRDSGGTP